MSFSINLANFSLYSKNSNGIGGIPLSQSAPNNNDIFIFNGTEWVYQNAPTSKDGPTGPANSSNISPTGITGVPGSSIIGPTGPTGPTLDAGPTGVEGNIGSIGPNSAIGITGPQGPTGFQPAPILGPTGASADIVGTGTTNSLTKWSSTNTVTNSIITESGSSVSFEGDVLSTGNIGSLGIPWNNIYLNGNFIWLGNTVPFPECFCIEVINATTEVSLDTTTVYAFTGVTATSTILGNQSLFSLNTAYTQFTCNLAGTYEVNIYMASIPSTDGQNYVFVRKNFTDQVPAVKDAAASSTHYLNGTGRMYLSEGDIVDITVRSTTGCTFGGTITKNKTQLYLGWVGSL